jgi:mono/diheme cytochrome c family protein
MTESLASAAEKMGVPEALVRRSAEARAKATGSSTEDILTAWAGGEAAPSAPPPAAEPEPESATPAADDTATSTEPEPQPSPTPRLAAATPLPTAARPSTPPVLVGRNDGLTGTVLGAVLLLGVSLLVGFAVASTPEDSNLAYTSRYAYSSNALHGRDVYLSEGCAACHTQVVRPLVADAALGGVTVSDTNQIIGVRRVGPDLAHIGSRIDTEDDLYAIIDGASGHPTFRGLGQSDLDALVSYLMEST